jgi:predicted dehydrogenase
LLGDFAELSSTLSTQLKTVKLISSKDNSVIDHERPKNSPDHIFINGTLETGAVASLAFRKALRPVDGVALRWIITGDKGELEFTAPSVFPQLPIPGYELKARVEGDSEVQTPDLETADEPDYVRSQSPWAINTSRLYEDYRNGGKTFSSFEDALKVRRLLDRIEKASKWAPGL